MLETGDGTTGSGVLNSDMRVGNLGKVSRPTLLEKQQRREVNRNPDPPLLRNEQSIPFLEG